MTLPLSLRHGTVHNCRPHPTALSWKQHDKALGRNREKEHPVISSSHRKTRVGKGKLDEAFPLRITRERKSVSLKVLLQKQAGLKMKHWK